MFDVRPVSEVQFSSVLQDIKTLVNRGLVDPELGTIPKQAQLLTELCMRMTPPLNNKGAGGDRMSNSQKEAGESAVARDINYIIKGRTVGYLESVIAITGKTENVRQNLRNKKGVTYLIDVDRIDVSGGQMAAWHKARRDSRGRISRSTSKSNDTVIGRWQSNNRLWVPGSELDAYRKKMQARVGWAKAGWLKAYNALKGTRAPAWVKRHGESGGSFVNGLNSPRPFVAIGNNTSWAASASAKATIQAAFAARARAMQTFFNTMMRLASEGKPTQWQARARAAANNEAA